MRSGMYLRQSIVVLCLLGIVVADEPTGATGEDPNATWVAVEHLSADWRSMGLTTTCFNPEKPEYSSAAPGRSILFSGEVNVIDPNGLIGLSTHVTDVLVVDEAGQSIEIPGASVSPLSYEPLFYSQTVWVPTGEIFVEILPFLFTIDVPMQYGAPFPQEFSKLEWSMSALLSDAFQVIDVPFAATNAYLELVPGLEILIEKATTKAGSYSFTSEVKYNWRKISYPKVAGPSSGPLKASALRGSRDDDEEEEAYSWSDENFPEAIVTSVDVLDAQGNSLWKTTTLGFTITDGSWTDSGDQRMLRWTVHGSCSSCGQAATIRYTIASAPYEREVRLEMRNIAVPEICP